VFIYKRGRGNLPDGVKRVRSETSTNGDTPAQQERGEERALESANEDDGLCERGKKKHNLV
jgi:hypothetical protein